MFSSLFESAWEPLVPTLNNEHSSAHCFNCFLSLCCLLCKRANLQSRDFLFLILKRIDIEERKRLNGTYVGGKDHKFGFSRVDFEVCLRHPGGVFALGQRKDTLAI